MSSPLLNLGHWIDCTEVEGPGKRFAIWTQGCHIRCPDCCNPELLPFVPNKLVDVDEMVRRIRAAHEQHGIEGITLLGGEPMIQARSLSVLAREVRQLGLTVVLFTGYVIGPDRKLPDGGAELLAQCDLVIDGPYVPSRQEEKRNWVGSTNQRFHYLTPAYDSVIETAAKYRNGVEIRLDASGQAMLNGFPF